MMSAIRFPSIAARVLRTRACPSFSAASSPSSSFAGRLLSTSATTEPVQFKGGASLTEEQIRKIGERDAAMRAAYDAMPSGYPEHARGEVLQGLPNPDDPDAAFRKRLLYRSKQRGW